MCAIPSRAHGPMIVLSKVQARMVHGVCCHLTAAAAALAKLQNWLDKNITDEHARYCFSCRRRTRGARCRRCDFATGDYEDSLGLVQDTRGARYTVEEALGWLRGEAMAFVTIHQLGLSIAPSMPIAETQWNPPGLVTASAAMTAAHEALGVLADQLDEQYGDGETNQRGLHRDVCGFWWQIQACCSLVDSHRVRRGGEDDLAAAEQSGAACVR